MFSLRCLVDIPCFLNRSGEDVSRRVHQIIDAAVDGIDLLHNRLDFVKWLHDIKIHGHSSFSLQVVDLLGVAGGRDDAVAILECFNSDVLAEARTCGRDEPDW